MKKGSKLFVTFAIFGAASVVLTACSEPEVIIPAEELNVAQSLEILDEFSKSGWRACDLGIEQGQQLEDMGYDDTPYPFWNCRGVFYNEYPYEIRIVAEPNGTEIRYTELEYKRGHNESFYALLRYYLRMQGIQSESERFDLRSQLSGIISSNPRTPDFRPVARLSDGRMLELAHNYPSSAFSTLRVRNPD